MYPPSGTRYKNCFDTKHMAHQEQIDFMKMVHGKFPQAFSGVTLLDIGSMDINGNNRYLLADNCLYVGIDIGAGPNVNLVASGHQFLNGANEIFGTIISTEAFEHDANWKETLANAGRLLKRGGLFAFTCATSGRPEHGTSRSEGWASPHTNDYYMNLTEADVRSVPGFIETFSEFEFQVNERSRDLYFWGIKA